MTLLEKSPTRDVISLRLSVCNLVPFLLGLVPDFGFSTLVTSNDYLVHELVPVTFSSRVSS